MCAVDCCRTQPTLQLAMAKTLLRALMTLPKMLPAAVHSMLRIQPPLASTRLSRQLVMLLNMPQTLQTAPKALLRTSLDMPAVSKASSTNSRMLSPASPMTQQGLVSKPTTTPALAVTLQLSMLSVPMTRQVQLQAMQLSMPKTLSTQPGTKLVSLQTMPLTQLRASRVASLTR